MPNPVILNSANDVHKGSVEIDAAVWTGTTTAGNWIELSSLSGDVLWKAQTDSANTYLPHYFNKLPADGGFKLTHHDAGQVLVYLVDDDA